MVLTLKNRKDISKLKKALNDRSLKKAFDAKKFCGSLKTNEDGMAIQQRLRDEWN
jgi:hypothetical protein